MCAGFPISIRYTRVAPGLINPGNIDGTGHTQRAVLALPKDHLSPEVVLRRDSPYRRGLCCLFCVFPCVSDIRSRSPSVFAFLRFVKVPPCG